MKIIWIIHFVSLALLILQFIVSANFRLEVSIVLHWIILFNVGFLIYMDKARWRSSLEKMYVFFLKRVVAIVLCLFPITFFISPVHTISSINQIFGFWQPETLAKDGSFLLKSPIQFPQTGVLHNYDLYGTSFLFEKKIKSIKIEKRFYGYEVKNFYISKEKNEAVLVLHNFLNHYGKEGKNEEEIKKAKLLEKDTIITIILP